MSRLIVFLAHKFESIEFVGFDQRTLEPNDTRRERYAEMRKELEKFGTVYSNRTSGVMARVSTPPEGIRFTQEDRDAHERRGKLRTQQGLLELIDKSQFLVAAVDGESETRGSLIEYALSQKRSILLLQHQVAITNFRPMYEHREGITFEIYDSKDRMVSAMCQFFNRFPVRAYG